MTTADLDGVVRALLNNDEQRLRLYTTSPTYRHGLDQAVQLLDVTLEGLALEAERADDRHRAAMNAALADVPDAHTLACGGTYRVPGATTVECSRPPGHEGRHANEHVLGLTW